MEVIQLHEREALRAHKRPGAPPPEGEGVADHEVHEGRHGRDEDVLEEDVLRVARAREARLPLRKAAAREGGGVAGLTSSALNLAVPRRALEAAFAAVG